MAVPRKQKVQTAKLGGASMTILGSFFQAPTEKKRKQQAQLTIPPQQPYKQPSGGLSEFELHQSEVFAFILASTPMRSSSETSVFGFGGITLVRDKKYTLLRCITHQTKVSDRPSVAVVRDGMSMVSFQMLKESY